MPNVPGLTPINAPSTPGITPQGGRVVPRDTTPDPQRLTPVAAPVDTYARVAQPDADNALMQLAQSLATIHAPLQQFAQVQAQEDRDELPGKITAARLTSASDADFQQRLRTDPALSGPLAQRLGNTQLGMSVAEQAVEGLKQQYQTGGFDRDHGDLDAWMNKQAQADFEAHKSDPSFATGYGQRFLQAREMLRTDLTRYRTDQAVNAQNQQIFGASLATVNGAADTSGDPSKTVGALLDQFHSNQTFLQKPPEEQARLQLQLVQNLQDKIPDDPRRAAFYHQVIGGLLNADRTGPDGKSIGSLLNDPAMGGKAADLLSAANRAYQTQDNFAHRDAITDVHELAVSGDPDFKATLDKQIAENPKRYSQEQVTSLQLAHDRAVAGLQRRAAAQQAEQGELNARANLTTQGLLMAQQGNLGDIQDATITNAKGNDVLVSAEDQIKAVTKARMAQIDQWALQHPDQPEAAMNARISFFARSTGAVNDQWRRNLTNGPRAVDVSVLAGGGIPPALHDAYQLYRQIQSKAPGILAGHTDNKSRDFYERARVAQDVQHMSEQQALSLAARASTDKSLANGADTLKPAEFNKLADGIFSTWTPFHTDVDQTPNYQMAREDLYRAADNLVKGNGLSPEEAVRQAGETLKHDYTVINGVAVKTADKRIPPNFGEVANRYFDQYYEAHKAELDHLGIDREHLSMAPIGNGNAWRVVITPMMADPDIPNSTISIREMQRVNEEIAAEQEKAGHEAIAASLADAQRSFYDRTMHLKAQVDAGHALNIGGLSSRLMTHETAKGELAQMMANPNFAAGKALREKAKADAIAVQQQQDMKNEQAQKGAEGVWDIPTP